MIGTAKNYRSEYKPTLNLAVDMVGACLTACKKKKIKPRVIQLAPPYWALFCDYVKEHDPESFDPYGIDFDGVIIEKGSIWQRDAIKLIMPEGKPAEAEA